jgi:hypothetical protein
MPLDRTVRNSFRTYTPASNMVLYVPPTIDQTTSLRTSSGHIIVKMIESRAPPDPPEAMTCSTPSFVQQQAERLRPHMRFRDAVELYVGPPAVWTVPQEHSLAAVGEGVGELVDAAVVLAEPATRRQRDDLPVLGPYEFVDDDAAVDLDLPLSHTCSSPRSDICGWIPRSPGTRRSLETI